ncbi:Ctr copper transporter [Pseudomassariella vexata]|uniref:Copper transport protein n=1 Tax=Pseudomassariella vexata TaxID=1141098 RepID=A0A1Y2E8J0_9PEZI|nr:Ctr copper transporter [Pseudomassariella vexata]ORY67596.1 Ctr copper transporter [Pseudomassariella vexata]
MVFFQSVTTPLFAMGWTPSSTGAYAGTCIFLIVLSFVHQVLLALRCVLFPASSRPAPDRLPLSDEYGDKESVGTRMKATWSSHPFRVATESSRAVFEVLVGGVAYLLMLAVMTLNVGYFLSVLGGIFLGTFVCGRFSGVDHHH